MSDVSKNGAAVNPTKDETPSTVKDGKLAATEGKGRGSKALLRNAVACLHKESVAKILYRAKAGGWLSRYYAQRLEAGHKRRDTTEIALQALALEVEGTSREDYKPDVLMRAYQTVRILSGTEPLEASGKAPWARGLSWAALAKLGTLLVRPNDSEDWSLKPGVDQEAAAHLFTRACSRDKKDRIGRETLDREVLRLADPEGAAKLEEAERAAKEASQDGAGNSGTDGDSSTPPPATLSGPKGKGKGGPENKPVPPAGGSNPLALVKRGVATSNVKDATDTVLEIARAHPNAKEVIGSAVAQLGLPGPDAGQIAARYYLDMAKRKNADAFALELSTLIDEHADRERVVTSLLAMMLEDKSLPVSDAFRAAAEAFGAKMAYEEPDQECTDKDSTDQAPAAAVA